MAARLHYEGMTNLLALMVLALLLLPRSVASAGAPPSSAADAACLPSGLSHVAAAVRPAVVAIRPAQHAGPLEGVLDQWLELQWGEGESREDLRDRLARALRHRSVGTGVIVDPSGLVLTSAQVLRLLGEVQVVTADGATPRATVVGIDERSDIAVLRLPPRSERYPFVPLADSDLVQVGDWVLAYGAPFGLDFSVSTGIVSATGRDIPDVGEPGAFLQTDAPLNAGNAGGPLVNLRGEVVGIAAGPSHPGVGFAVSSNVVRKVFDALRTRGYVSRAWLGVAFQPLTPELASAVGLPDVSGVLVLQLAPEGPAARGGFRRGDVVLALDDTVLREPGDVDRALARHVPEEVVRLRLWRDGRERTLRLSLGEEVPERDLATDRSPRALGLEVAPITPEMGVVVIRVIPGSAAEKNGARRGDVVREMNGQPVPTMDAFVRLARMATGARPLLVLLQRGSTAFYAALRPDR